jgi:hypothetical protein
MSSTRTSTQMHAGNSGNSGQSLQQPYEGQWPDFSDYHAQLGTKAYDITVSSSFLFPACSSSPLCDRIAFPNIQPSFTLTLGQLTGRLVYFSAVWFLEFRDSCGSRVDDRHLAVTSLGEERVPVPIIRPDCPVWFLSEDYCYELKCRNIVKTLSFPRRPQID